MPDRRRHAEAALEALEPLRGQRDLRQQHQRLPALSLALRDGLLVLAALRQDVDAGALAGAEILFYPTAIGWHPSEKAAFGKQQYASWETIQRSHAIANPLPTSAAWS